MCQKLKYLFKSADVLPLVKVFILVKLGGGGVGRVGNVKYGERRNLQISLLHLLPIFISEKNQCHHHHHHHHHHLHPQHHPQHGQKQNSLLLNLHK